MSEQGQLEMERRLADGLVWAKWAVRRWAGFPVTQRPRPLILVGSPVTVARGFDSGQAKHAYLDGLVDVVVPLPSGVLEALPPKRAWSGSGPEPKPLRITEATRAEAEFRTDRGLRRLPAWRLTLTGALGPLWVLDPEIDPPQWYPPDIAPPELQRPVGDPGARALLEDERTLTVEVLGALPEYERYLGGEVIETPQAVAVVPVGEDIGPPGIRILPGSMHRVTVQLQRPLGGRVFVDLHGNAGEVSVAANAQVGAVAHRGVARR